MARKTITIIFVWSGRRVEVPAHVYETFKHVDAGSLLEARAPKASRARR